MKNNIFKYGLYSTVLLVSLFLLSHFIIGSSPENYGLGEIVGYSSIVVSLIFIYFGIRQYRDENLGGAINFWQALKVGLLIALFPAIAFGLYNVIYAEIINPDFMETYYTHQLEEMQATMNEADFQVAKAQMESEKEMFFNPFFNFILMFVTVLVIGLVITIISSFPLAKLKSSKK